jgi:hypothetical protein
MAVSWETGAHPEQGKREEQVAGVNAMQDKFLLHYTEQINIMGEQNR